MQNLKLALQARGQEGEPLPPVFGSLDRMGAKFRRGQVTLLAGASGGGKSAFAIYQATRLAYDEFTSVPSLYFSADCDRITVAQTILAGVMKKPLYQCEELLDLNDEAALGVLDRATEHVWWNFQSSPSVGDILKEIEAYQFVHGESPHHIIVDNLMDVLAEGESDKRLTNVMLELNDIARDTGAHVLVLCHVGKAKEKAYGQSYSDGLIPIPRSAILGAVDQKATLILTLYRSTEDTMGVCMVKSRSGKALADASVQVHMGWMPSHGWFGGFE